MFFRQVFDTHLAQYAYIVGCQQTGEAIVIDPQRDIDRYVDIAAGEALKIIAAAETHIHADFLSGAREFAERYDVAVYLSDEGDADWKYFWAQEGAYDHRPLKDGDVFRIGNIAFEVVHTPGHTPEHISFLITDEGGGADVPMGLASGDFVFVGDLGRPDLLETAAGQAGAREPAAEALYRSVQDFLGLPEYLQIWPGHGAGSACGKALGAIPETTVGYEKRFNSAILAAQRGEEAFVAAILDGQPEPPIYFARMKHENKYGPAVLGALPRPALLTAADLNALAGRPDAAVVDMRADRSAFMQRHLKGSLYAPMDKTFPTVTGSYITPDQSIYLIAERPEDVHTAVLDLIRIGLDDVAGYALTDALDDVTHLASTPEIDATEMDAARGRDGVTVLDVRRLAEYVEGHVPGAVNMAHTRLMERHKALSPGETYLVHCRSGARSAVATAFLAQQGYDVTYVNGTYASWAAQGQPERGEPISAV